MSEGHVEHFTEHDIRAKHATDADDQGFYATINLQHNDRRKTQVYLRAKKVLCVKQFSAEDFISD